MVMSDPIADMLTRIRNANIVRHETVEMPASTIKKEIAEILKQEGFIRDAEYVEDNKQGIIRIFLKYGPNNERVITGLKRISKPGLRVYTKSNEVPRVLGGLGIAIISTSKGVMTDKEARQAKVGRRSYLLRLVIDQANEWRCTMSRIGRKPIQVPNGVNVSVNDTVITVKGPKGTLSRELHKEMKVVVDGNVVTVERPSDNKLHRSLHGTTRRVIANMVNGVTEGFQKTWNWLASVTARTNPATSSY